MGHLACALIGRIEPDIINAERNRNERSEYNVRQTFHGVRVLARQEAIVCRNSDRSRKLVLRVRRCGAPI